MAHEMRRAGRTPSRFDVRGLLLSGVACATFGCGAGGPPTSPDLPAPVAPSPPAATPAPLPSPTVESAAPELVARIRPRTFNGPAPFEVTVDLCDSSDPDGDTLVYAYEWEQEGKRLSPDCLARHVYDRPTKSRAFFCVWDRHPEHLVCTNRAVDVF